MEYNVFSCSCQTDIIFDNAIVPLKVYKCIMKNYLNYAKVRNFITTQQYDNLCATVSIQTEISIQIIFSKNTGDINLNTICLCNRYHLIESSNDLCKYFECKIAKSLIDFLLKHIGITNDDLHNINILFQIYEKQFNKKFQISM